MHTSLEIAHIYGDQEFSEETRRGLEYARWFIDNVGESNVTTVVLVDDVHAKMSLDIDHYVKLIELEGVLVDTVVLESSLINVGRDLAKRLRPGIFSQSFDRGQRVQTGFDDDDERWIATTENNMPTCATMSAAFTLARWYGHANFVRRYTDSRITADKVVNILPNRFTRVEEKAYQILQRSDFRDRLKDLDLIFHG